MEGVLNGPFGRTILGPVPLIIGRTPDNQLVVNDPSASAHHAEIRPEGQGYSIVDLGSNNGTFVQEQRLNPYVPRMLYPGDTVRIGDTRFTYEGTGMAYNQPPAYAGAPLPGALPSQPFTAYGADTEQAPYAPPPPPPGGSYSSPTYPPSFTDYTPPPPPQKPNRRGLWIALGGIIAALVIAAVVVVTFLLVNRSTPTKTLQAYCNAINSHDVHTAYEQRTSTVNTQTEAQFGQSIQNISNCNVGNVNDSTGAGTITFILDGHTLTADESLVQENGTWKINGGTIRSTPFWTFANFCSALDNGDYQTAYNLFSSSLQSQVGSESQFASSIGSNKVTNCNGTNISDTAGTGTLTLTYTKGDMESRDLTLTQESGTWKINAVSATPTEVLNSYCSALKVEDYQTAYNDLSSSTQSSVGSESQFANAFISNKVTNCTVSNVNDSGGTGTMSFTYSDGSSKSFVFTLVNQNGTWYIQSAK